MDCPPKFFQESKTGPIYWLPGCGPPGTLVHGLTILKRNRTPKALFPSRFPLRGQISRTFCPQKGRFLRPLHGVGEHLGSIFPPFHLGSWRDTYLGLGTLLACVLSGTFSRGPRTKGYLPIGGKFPPFSEHLGTPRVSYSWGTLRALTLGVKLPGVPNPNFPWCQLPLNSWGGTLQGF